MKGLFEPSAVQEIKARLDQLTPASPRQWGKMNAAQAVAHLGASMECAVGDRRPPRMFIGRFLGPLVTGMALGDRPMQRNAPTAPDLVVSHDADFDRERARLRVLIDRFASGGPAACTTHPHQFFGGLTPQQWARLMYKHLDHHLRQFGV